MSAEQRFTVREADDEALEVVDGGAVVVCTCWQEPNFAYDIARLLNGDEKAVVALGRIAHHQREGDYAGQVNAMRAIASAAVASIEAAVRS